MQSNEKIEKSLLFVHQGALGDFIVTFPVLRSLRAGFSRIDGICRAEFGRLARHLTLIENFHPQDAAHFASLYITEADPLVAELLNPYDHILLFSFSDTLEKSIRRFNSSAVHTIPPWPREEEHTQATEFLFQRLKEAKLLPPDAGPATGALEVDPLSDTGCGEKAGPGSRILLCPGAGSIAKRWPLASYLVLSDMLRRAGFRPEWVLGPVEQDLASELTKPSAAIAVVHRNLSLVQLADLLQSAAGYVGNDSAVSHLAAFLQVPAVVIFGPSSPDRWRPAGPCVRVVQAATSSRSRSTTAKTGCIGADCVKQVSPAMVLTSFQNLVGK